jgi:peptidoglycan/xylan/chitin deacetylase (PgdA/CDA1 family)
MRRNLSIVTYHDISAESGPLTAQLLLSTRPEVFRSHVAYFAKNFDIISVDELLAGNLPRRPLLLTFDDAYRSVLTVAGPILKERDTPSIFFVIPSVLHGDKLPIDNVLSLAVEEMGLPEVRALMNVTEASAKSVGEIISRFIAPMRPVEIAMVKAKIFSALGTTEEAARRASDRFLNGAEVGKLADYRIEVGNHSMTHSHFRGLSREELDFQIGQSRRELQRLSGQPVRCISVPYGDELDATHDAIATARTSGHQAIFLVHARSNRFRPSDDTYYRISLRNEQTWRVRVEIEVFPLMRSMYHGLALPRRTR